MSYEPVRALTEGELSYLRQDGQYTKLRAVIIPQSTILACKCAETKTDNDAVTFVAVNTITSGSGVYVRNGMTAYVGSGSGLDDLGMLRVKSFSDNTLYFARVSGITWTPDVFITVVDDFGLWAKLPTLDLTEVRMDDDIVYTDQNVNMPPVPVFGADTAVPLSSGSLIYDATNSYSLNDAVTTMSAYVWAVFKDGLPSGTITSSGSGVAVFTFDTTGSYEIQLTLTDSNGKSAVGHRTCYVYDDSASDANVLDQIQIKSVIGERENGSWSCEVTAYAGAGSAVRDRAKVIVIAEDYYPDKISFGQYENGKYVVMTGWISGETIRYNSEESTVNFKVTNAVEWLKSTTGPSTFLETFPEVTQEQEVWTVIPNLTINKVAHHFLYWRSTAIEILDFYPSRNTRIIGGISASIGSIYEQINDTAKTRMLHYFGADKYNRLFLWEDPQVLASGSRASIPVIATFEKGDLTEDVNMPRTILPTVSLLEVAGLAVPPYAVSGSATVLMYMSRAPGSLIYNRYGANDQNDRLVVTDQNDANMLSGMLLAKRNNEYPSSTFTLAQNNRMLDIAPGMYFRHEVSPSDNARNVTITSETNFLPMRIEYIVDEKGAVSVSIDAEKETSGIPGYTVVIPQEPIVNIPEPYVPPINPYPWIPYPYIPPIIPPYVIPDPPVSGSYCREGSDPFGPYDISLYGQLYSANEFGLIQLYPAWVRPKTSANPTRYEVRAGAFICLASGSLNDPNYVTNPQILPASAMSYASFSGSAAGNWWEVVLLDSFGEVVATGVKDPVTIPGVYTGTFDNTLGADFTYFAIRSKTEEGLPPDFITSGSGLGILLQADSVYNGYSEPGNCTGDFNPILRGSSYTIEPTANKGIHLRGSAVIGIVNSRYGLNNGIQFLLYWTKSGLPTAPTIFHMYGSMDRENGAEGFCRIRFDGTSEDPLVPIEYTSGNNFDFLAIDHMVNVYENGLRFLSAKYFTSSSYPEYETVDGVINFNFIVEPVSKYILDITSVNISNVCAQTTSGLP